MRFLILLTALTLLPVAVGVHAWRFVRHQQPELQAQALGILRKEGFRGAAAELRFLDLRITGDAPDPAAMARAISALEAMGPTRLVVNELSVPASLSAELESEVLRLQGWLPDEGSAAEVVNRLAVLRPDLEIDRSGVNVSPQVRWPEGAVEPLADQGALLKGILQKLRVTPSLSVTATDGGLVAAGALPTEAAREAVIQVLRQVLPEVPVNTSALMASAHVTDAPFVEPSVLEPFLRSFYATPSPGSFSLSLDRNPRLEAAATSGLEAEWLRLLRPLTGGKKVDMQLALYPSIYHFPGYRPQTLLPAGMLEEVRQALSDFYIVFGAGSAALPSAAEARLSGLASTLLQAGPALRLVVGGHPEPQGDVAAQRRLALARAEQVRSFLIEQGAPGAEIEAIAFEPVPADAPGASLQPHSVEILVK